MTFTGRDSFRSNGSFRDCGTAGAGSKLSRDMINGSYQAFQSVVNIVLELIRQFYTAPRVFRITNDTGENFVSFDNSGMQAQEMEVGFTGMIAERKLYMTSKYRHRKQARLQRFPRTNWLKKCTI